MSVIYRKLSTVLGAIFLFSAKADLPGAGIPVASIERASSTFRVTDTVPSTAVPCMIPATAITSEVVISAKRKRIVLPGAPAWCSLADFASDKRFCTFRDDLLLLACWPAARRVQVGPSVNGSRLSVSIVGLGDGRWSPRFADERNPEGS